MAQGVPVQIVGVNGRLVGADNVSVAGTAYNVRLVDGLAANLGLLSHLSNPFFSRADLAEAASVALREIANTGTFGAQPQLITGFGHPDLCSIVTVFEPFMLLYQENWTQFFHGYEMVNWAGHAVDYRDGNVNPWNSIASYDLGTQDGGGNVFAVWTLASPHDLPEPGVLPLLAVGVVAARGGGGRLGERGLGP